MKCLCMCICWVYLYEYIWRGTARRTFVYIYVFCVCLVVLLDLFLARWNVCACVYAVYTSAFMLWVCEYIIKGMARTTNLFVYSVRRTARRTYLYIYIYIYVSHMYTVYVWWCPFWLVVGAMKCLRMCVYMLWILIGICWFFFQMSFARWNVCACVFAVNTYGCLLVFSDLLLAMQYISTSICLTHMYVYICSFKTHKCVVLFCLVTADEMYEHVHTFNTQIFWYKYV